jgi:hypothetical protein
LRLLFVLFVVALAAAQNSLPDESATPVVLRGTVINRLTRDPVPRALVSTPDNRFAVMTDGQGRFEFQLSGTQAGVLPLLRSQLAAQKPGFLDDRNGPTGSSLEGSELALELTPEALIIGRVTLPSSEPPDAIMLELYKREVQEGRAHWISAGNTSTRSNGEFRFSNLAAGTYKLFTRELLDEDPLTASPPGGQAYGYAPVYFPSSSDFTTAAEISLTPGKSFQANLSLLRQPYYSVRIPVTGMIGISEMNVNVMSQGHPGPGYSLGYNPGEQRIEGLLPRGNFMVEASSLGQQAAAGRVAISVNSSTTGPALVVVSARQIPVEVNEEFTRDITSGSQFGLGNSFSEGRRSLRSTSYLNLRLEPSDDFSLPQAAWARPAPNGQMVIGDVRPGQYWVRATTARGYIASMTSGGLDLLHSPLVVGAGGASPIEVTLRDDGAQIKGTVDGINLTSLAGSSTTVGPPAFVYCIPLPDSSGQFALAGVGNDGSVQSPSLAPGTYRLLAFRRAQELEYRNPDAMRAYEDQGTVIRLVGGQTENVRLQVISD